MKRCTCGERPLVEEIQHNEDFSQYFVICDNCGSQSGTYNTAEFAIERWNVRIERMESKNDVCNR